MSNPWQVALLPMAAVLGLGVLVSSLSSARVAARNEERLQRRVQVLVDEVADQVAGGMETYAVGLRGARGALIGAGAQGMSRELFQRYIGSRVLSQEFPGARGFGYIPREAHRAADDIALDTIAFLEPSQPYAMAPTSRIETLVAARTAIESGEPTLTAPMRVVAATDRQHRTAVTAHVRSVCAVARECRATSSEHDRLGVRAPRAQPVGRALPRPRCRLSP